jgi:hypothetical protein
MSPDTDSWRAEKMVQDFPKKKKQKKQHNKKTIQLEDRLKNLGILSSTLFSLAQTNTHR